MKVQFEQPFERRSRIPHPCLSCARSPCPASSSSAPVLARVLPLPEGRNDATKKSTKTEGVDEHTRLRRLWQRQLQTLVALLSGIRSSAAPQSPRNRTSYLKIEAVAAERDTLHVNGGSSSPLFPLTSPLPLERLGPTALSPQLMVRSRKRDALKRI